MNVRLVGIVLATLIVSPSWARAAESPPRNLHLVDGHWTAWEPPTPPPDAKVHVIERGDTLWDLAARFSGDPYLWPQLWERNRYILDAHWIYPGDPLVLGPEVTPVESLADAGEPAPEEAPPTEGVLTADAAAGAPVPLGAESDIYCTGYIGDLDETFPYGIAGSEYEVLAPKLSLTSGRRYEGEGRFGRIGAVKVDLSTGDVVYLDSGRAAGLSAGAVFQVVEPAQPVVHPHSQEVFGRLYRYLGRVRVLSVQETTAIAEIVHSCDPIHVGARLRPFEPEPVPLGRPTAMRPLNYPAAAEALAGAPVILMGHDQVISLGEDHVVYIDRGADADVTPGDVYTIYRMNRDGLPPVVLGELAVLSVHARSSVAKILDSRYFIFAGDRLDPK